MHLVSVKYWPTKFFACFISFFRNFIFVKTVNFFDDNAIDFHFYHDLWWCRKKVPFQNLKSCRFNNQFQLISFNPYANRHPFLDMMEEKSVNQLSDSLQTIFVQKNFLSRWVGYWKVNILGKCFTLFVVLSCERIDWKRRHWRKFDGNF